MIRRSKMEDLELVRLSIERVNLWRRAWTHPDPLVQLAPYDWAWPYRRAVECDL
jgi:hypothetical protein